MSLKRIAELSKTVSEEYDELVALEAIMETHDIDTIEGDAILNGGDVDMQLFYARKELRRSIARLQEEITKFWNQNANS